MRAGALEYAKLLADWKAKPDLDQDQAVKATQRRAIELPSLILLPQNEIRYALTGQAGYLFPRADGIVLGGTFELDQWETTPQPEAILRILSSHQRLFSGFRCSADAPS